MLKKIFLTLSLSFALMTGYANPSSMADSDLPKEPIATVEVCDNNESEQLQAELGKNTEKAVVSPNAAKAAKAAKSQKVKENDPYGFTVTVIAMVIVIVALIILAILFLLFGKASSKIQAKKKRVAQGVDKTVAGKSSDYVDSGEVIAAISMALAEHFDSAHDMEDTVLTIKRMKRAYSPWNSKIYNMREVPQVNKK